MKDPSRHPLTRGRSVQQDWRAWLPEEKAHVFYGHERHLKSLYYMFSVSLNEAMELKQAGFLAKALSAISMTSALCERLSWPLAGMLRALYDHARHYGTIPNAAPMDPANYQGQRGQRSARMSGLLERVLFSQRFQFLHKVSTLEEMVEDLGRDFHNAAEALADGQYPDPERWWHEMDADHYDLNTCLRETFVLFKSFLIVLPVGQLADFEKKILDQYQFPEGDGAPSRVIQHRRIDTFA